MGTGRPSLFEGELLECIYCYCSAVLHERQAPETNLSSQSKKTSPTLKTPLRPQHMPHRAHAAHTHVRACTTPLCTQARARVPAARMGQGKGCLRSPPLQCANPQPTLPAHATAHRPLPPSHHDACWRRTETNCSSSLDQGMRRGRAAWPTSRRTLGIWSQAMSIAHFRLRERWGFETVSRSV